MIDEDKLYAAAIGLWGQEPQMRMAQEECAELIVAINKLSRAHGHMNTIERWADVCDEIADVEIMMRQLRMCAGPVHNIDSAKSIKLARLKKRLETHGVSFDEENER